LLLFAATAGLQPAPAAARLAPDRNGVIHACFATADGNELHITRSARSCARSEQSLSWNQRGLPGNALATVSAAFASVQVNTGGVGGNGGTGGQGGAGGEGGAGGSGGQGGAGGEGGSGGGSFWSWVDDAVPALKNMLLLFGLSALALSILLVPVGWLFARPRSRWLARGKFLRWFGPALQIQPFEDGAMTEKIGSAFALAAQARVRGGREAGQHLYLVTGEQSPGAALADLQGVPQTQAFAVALSFLKLTWRRRRLIVSGSLQPASPDGAAAVALSLRRNSKFLCEAEFWPSEPPSADMTVWASNRVLAVAVAGWIEYTVVDHTPGPPAREKFLANGAVSWALFRAGSESSRISQMQDAADYYERALALDRENIGALVDLAHLRRRERYFSGAATLVSRAVYLIEKRHSKYGMRRDDDADWYRAQMVWMAVHAEWAKRCARDGESLGVEVHRQKAFERALSVAREAMDARDRLEAGLEGVEAFTEQAKLRVAERAQLRELLETTFEPGVLLLVAGNCGIRCVPPLEVEETSFYEAQQPTLDTRKEVRARLDAVRSLDPAQVVEYVSKLPFKSPRVVYNLACCYCIAAGENPTSSDTYLDIALEYLRESVSRIAPPERRGLLEHAKKDWDLALLCEARHDRFYALWDTVQS
jgi:tetratricopeptide (TPR) repeat protein